MRFHLFLLALLLPVLVYAQPRGYEYIDVVYLKGGRELVGTIVEYMHEEKLSIVLENGSLKEFNWDEVRRVNFKLDKTRLRDASRVRSSPTTGEVNLGEDSPTTTAEFRPTRKFMHQVTGAINLGSTGPFSTTIGGSFSYHFTKDISFLKIGLGADLSLMSDLREENVAAITGFGEYAFLGKFRHIRPIIRFEAGPAYPFTVGGDDNNSILERQVSILFHPSIGLAIQPKKGQWGGLIFDLGYRFLDSKFTIITPNLDELERTVNYRRLFIRGGIRF